MTASTYRRWHISYDPPPILYRGADWQATHPDFDASYEGPEDGWVYDARMRVTAGSLVDLIAEIDEAEDELQATTL